MASGPITEWQIERGKVEVMTDFFFLGSKITGQWLQPWNQKTIASWQESDDKSRQCVEKQRHHSADKGPYSQGYGLPSGHVQLWGLTIKKAERRRIDAFELWCWRRLLKVPWTARRSNQSIKGDQSWIFTGRTDAEAEAPVIWSSDVNRRLPGKVPDAGKDWGQKKKTVSEDEMAGWMASLMQWTWAWANQKMVRDREAWRAAVHGVAKSWTWLGDWITTTAGLLCCVVETNTTL